MAVAQRVAELVPVMRERFADLETPVSAFAKLAHLDGAFLLESVEGGERLGRYSFIGVLPRERLVVREPVDSEHDETDDEGREARRQSDEFRPQVGGRSRDSEF